MKRTTFGCCRTLLLGMLLAAVLAPRVGMDAQQNVFSFEDGTTSPVAVWYQPGSVTNASGGHTGTRSVAVTGNVRIGHSPSSAHTASIFWLRGMWAATIPGQIQYFAADWQKLRQDFFWLTADTTWREQTVPFNKPAGTTYVFVGLWMPDGMTGHIDDVTMASSAPPPPPPPPPAPGRPFADSSAWNQPANHAPYTLEAHPELASVHWWVNREEYSFPLVVSSGSDPVVAVATAASWNRPAQTISVRIPAGVDGASGTDRSLQVTQDGVTHSFWQFHRTSATTATAQAYGSTPLTGDGFTDPVTQLNAGIRAAMASPLGGLIVRRTLDIPEIDHALAVSLPPGMLAPGWVPPARAEDGNSGSTYSGSIHMGSRLVATGSQPAGLSPIGVKVWRALVTYGGLVVDSSGSPALYVDPRSTTSAEINPLRVYWCPDQCAGSDLDRIVPRLQVARY